MVNDASGMYRIVAIDTDRTGPRTNDKKGFSGNSAMGLPGWGGISSDFLTLSGRHVWCFANEDDINVLSTVPLPLTSPLLAKPREGRRAAPLARLQGARAAWSELR
jgi:hypothetical protein